MRTIRTAIVPILTLGILANSWLGAAAQEAPAPPVEFSGRLLYGPQVVVGTEEQAEGRYEIRGHAFRTPVGSMSDPRLDGRWTRTNNIDQHAEPSVWTWQATWRVENDQGAWEGVETPIVFADGSRSTTTAVLVGEGAYEGLTAVTEFDHEGEGWDLRGIVVEGEIPPPPEAASE